jgi:HJR/Mrr/RecB family endonuclease
MLIFETAGLLLRFILFIPIIILMVEAMVLTKDFLKVGIVSTNNLNRWEKGEINIYDLHSLTPREFEFWCAEFISRFGYTDMIHNKSGSGGGKDIICTQNSLPVYVECKRYLYKTDAPYVVDDQVCRKLIGAMVHDGVTKGLIITSGIITSDAVEYIRTLPKSYEIQLLDGLDLIRQYSYLHQGNLQTA